MTLRKRQRLPGHDVLGASAILTAVWSDLEPYNQRGKAAPIGKACLLSSYWHAAGCGMRAPMEHEPPKLSLAPPRTILPSDVGVGRRAAPAVFAVFRR